MAGYIGKQAVVLSTTAADVNGNADIDGTVTADGLTVDTNTLHVDATNNRVGIGTSSPAIGLDVVAPTGKRNSARFTPNGSPNGQYIGITTCHANPNGAGAGWETGAIGVNIADGFDATTNKPKINNTSGGWDAGAAITLSPNDGSIQFYNADGGSAGTVLSERMRVTTNGLTFNGDTAAANALDDYEEGTWTATDDSAAGLTLTQSQGGTYVKVGKMCYVQIYITFPTTSNGDVVQIGGLPFTAGGGYAHFAVRVNGYATNDCIAQVAMNNTFLNLRHNNVGLTNNQISGAYVLFSGVYQTT